MHFAILAAACVPLMAAGRIAPVSDAGRAVAPVTGFSVQPQAAGLAQPGAGLRTLADLTPSLSPAGATPLVVLPKAQAAAAAPDIRAQSALPVLAAPAEGATGEAAAQDAPRGEVVAGAKADPPSAEERIKGFIETTSQRLGLPRAADPVSGLLGSHAQRFDSAFKRETGIDGPKGLKELLFTVDRRRARLQELAAKYGAEAFEPELKKTEAFIQAVHELVRKLEANEFEIVIFTRNPGRVKDLLQGETWKNYFETGRTKGNYSQASRLKAEASLLGLEPSEYAAQAPEELRPKYAMLRLKGEPGEHTALRAAKAYGAHAFVFDGAQYADQLTFSIGDSYDRLGGYVRAELHGDMSDQLDRKVELPSWSYHFIPWQSRLLMAAFSLDAFEELPWSSRPSLVLAPEVKALEIPPARMFGLWYFEGQVWGPLDRKGLIRHEYYPAADAGSEAGTLEIQDFLKMANIPSVRK